MGDNKEAIKIYKQILHSNPTERRAFTRLKQIYIQEGDYMEAIKLITNWLKHSPHDIQQKVELGEMYFLANDTTAAFFIWEEFKQIYVQNSAAYRLLINSYMKLGLTAEMENLIEQGRITFKQPDFMMLELGDYYFSRQNIAEASKHYLLYLEANPQQQKLVLDKITILTADDEYIPLIENQLLTFTAENPVKGHDLLASFYFMIGKFEESYQHLIQINFDQQQKYARFNQFADDLRKEGQFDLAIKTYQNILDEIHQNSKQPDPKLMGKVLIGLGQVYEEQIQPDRLQNSLIVNEMNNVVFAPLVFRTNQMSMESIQQAMQIYHSILDDFPGTSFSPQAHYRLGEIQFRVLGDIDGARKSFENALKSFPDQGLLFQIHFSFIDLLLVEGRISDAQEYIQKLELKHQNFNNNDLFLYRLKITLFEGLADSSLAMLNDYILLLSPSDPDFNDLMDLQSILSGPENKHVIGQYLHGEFLVVQNKIPEAMHEFSSLRSTNPQSPFAFRSIIREILFSLQLNKAELTHILLNELMQSGNKEKGLVFAGEIAEKVNHEMDRALNYYEQFLHEFPHSVYSEPVRLHLRELKAKIES